MIAAVEGVEQGGCRCPDLGENLCVGGSGGSVVWVEDVGDDTTHWEGFGQISPQGVPQADGMTTSERSGRWMGVSTTGGSDGGGGITGGGDLRLPPPEQSLTVNCNQVHYGTVSRRGEVSRGGLGRDVDSNSGGVTDREGGGDGRDGDGDGLNRWEDTAEKVILGTKPNSPFAYASGL